MADFVVIATADPAPIKQKLKELFSPKSFLIARQGAWLVRFDGTTQALAEKLKIRTEQFVAPGIVFSVGNFSGRASPNIWEWLTSQTKKDA